MVCDSLRWVGAFLGTVTGFLYLDLITQNVSWTRLHTRTNARIRCLGSAVVEKCSICPNMRQPPMHWQNHECHRCRPDQRRMEVPLAALTGVRGREPAWRKVRLINLLVILEGPELLNLSLFLVRLPHGNHLRSNVVGLELRLLEQLCRCPALDIYGETVA